MSWRLTALIPVCAALALLVGSEHLVAQETPEDPIREARTLQRSGDLEAAIERLRIYLRDRPGEPTALRLLASAHEARGELVAARDAYAAALRRLPDDPLLRLDYARVLARTGEAAAAREVLRPLAEAADVPPRLRADAWVQLGRLELQEGNGEGAESRFGGALALEARHPEALRLLRAMHRERAEWLRFDGGVDRDDQPVRRYGTGLGGGMHLYPWLSAEIGAEARQLGAEATQETLSSARAVLRGSWEPLRLEGSVWGEGYRRFGVGENDLAAGSELILRGPAGIHLRAESRRGPYLRTAASLEVPLTVVSVEGTLGRPEADGWAGALSYREDRFEDHESIEEATAWFLAPVVRQPAGIVRLGYRFRTAESGETAFVPRTPRQLDSAGQVIGRYDPIYTPRELRSHSVLFDARHQEEDGTRLFVEGSVGFDAQEDAPVLFPAVPGSPDAGTDLQLRRRGFTPWHLRASVRIPLAPELLAGVAAGYRQTAFRGRSLVQAEFTFYDLPADLR